MIEEKSILKIQQELIPEKSKKKKNEYKRRIIEE